MDFSGGPRIPLWLMEPLERSRGIGIDAETSTDGALDLRRVSEPEQPPPEPEPEPEPEPVPVPGPAPQPAHAGVMHEMLNAPTPRMCVYPFHRMVASPVERPARLPVLAGAGPPYAVWLKSSQVKAAAVLPWVVRASGTNHGAVIGRAYCAGVLLPARVDLDMFCAFVGWEGDVQVTYTFEVLVVLRGTAEWMLAREGDAPAQALPVGLGLDCEPVYAARVFRASRWYLGRVMASEGACMVVEEGEEIAFNEYEVLVIIP